MIELLGIALTQFIAFICFILLLKRFAVGPVLKLLDERREKIAGQFDEIAAAEKRVAAMKDEYEARLREIDEEARRRINEEVSRGRRIAEEIAENARAESLRIIEKAHANVKIQIDQARVELKDEVVALAIAAAEKLIGERFDAERDQRLVASFIDEIERKG